MVTQQWAFLNRDLYAYPTTSRRVWYLTLSVAATFVLYYEAYMLPSVAPLVLPFFIRVVVVSTLASGLVVTNVLNPAQWATWWWVDIAGYLAFLPTITLNTGYWSPARARAAVQAKLREEGLAAELAATGAESV